MSHNAFASPRAYKWRCFTQQTKEQFQQEVGKMKKPAKRKDTYLILDPALGDWVYDMNLKIKNRNGVIPIFEIKFCDDPDSKNAIFKCLLKTTLW